MANLKGQPGNKSRTKMPKPAGSGKQNSIGSPVVSLTVRIGLPQKLQLIAAAHAAQQSTGEFLRYLITIALEAYETQTEDARDP